MSDYDYGRAVWARGEHPREMVSITRTMPTEVCPTCEGSGVIGYIPGPTPEYIKCECVAAKTSPRKAALEGYETQTFATFVAVPGVERHAQRCYDYSLNPTNWLFLIGPYGTGKSHLSAAIANAVAARGGSVYFATVPDLLSDLKATFDGGGESFTTRFNRIRNVDLLVMDDFGAETKSEWNTEKLFQIVNHRYQRSMPTVISTNNAISTFHPRIASRLGDVVLVERLDFGGAADFRSLPESRRAA